MALNAKNVPGGGNLNIVPMENGTYPGRVAHVVDMGLQPQRPFQGQEKPPHQEILFTYEFVDEFMLDEDGQPDEGKPRFLSERMPLHHLGSERAKSTKRYAAFDPQGVHDGDFAACAGTPVNITVVQNPKPDGKVFENIAGVSTMRAKDAEKCPELVNAPLVFDLDDPDLEVFMALPKWVQDTIKGNLNYNGSKLAKLLNDAGVPAKDEGDEEGPPF